jgi:hypothetical protein
MNALKNVIHFLSISLKKGTKRGPENYLLFDEETVKSHFRALTNIDGIPKAYATENGMELGVSLGVDAKSFGNVSRQYDIPIEHLFESIEDVLRRNYKDISKEKSIDKFTSSFIWTKGQLEIPPLNEKVITLKTENNEFVIRADEKNFSSFFRPLIKGLNKVSTPVEVFGYLPNAETQKYPTLGPLTHQIIVPSVIINQKIE